LNSNKIISAEIWISGLKWGNLDDYSYNFYDHYMF